MNHPLLRSTLIFAMGLAALHASPAAAMPTPSLRGYAPVHGLQMYYEIHGSARDGQVPLVLLHGGGDTIETSFGALLPVLARERQVIAFEQQGYGRTEDLADRPFTFEQSADDTAALLDHLKISRADVLGFSNGGTISLVVAMRHPNRVRRIIAASALASRDGVVAGFWEMMEHAQLETMPSELREAYRRVAPKPENLRLLHDKAAHRMRTFRDLPVDALRAIQAPVLLLSGDTDVVTPEHMVALFRLLPNARVAILPDCDHGQVLTRPGEVAPLIARFLDASDTTARPPGWD